MIRHLLYVFGLAPVIHTQTSLRHAPCVTATRSYNQQVISKTGGQWYKWCYERGLVDTVYKIR